MDLPGTLPPVAADAPVDLVDDTVEEVEEMNGDSWATVVENGLADGPLRLELRVSAPNEPAADELVEFLAQHDYDVAKRAPEGDFDDWTVGGTTPDATADEAGLAEWVRRLTAAALEHGGCVLDGWTVVLE